MARGLKPCGTMAAYRRHLRRGEDPCDECREANTAASAASREKRAGSPGIRAVPNDNPGVVGPDPVPEVPVASPMSSPNPDPLEVARSSLRVVEQALFDDAVPAGSVAGLTRRREELVEKIRALSGAGEPEVSALDQLAARRARRQSAS